MSVAVADRESLIAPAPLQQHDVVSPFALFGSGVEPSVDRDGPPETPVPGFVVEARQLVARLPNSPIALARLASAELASGLRDDAAASATEGARQLLATPDLGAAIAISQVMSALGRLEEAGQVLEPFRGNEGAVLLLASISADFGDDDAAIEILGPCSTAPALAAKAWLSLKRGDAGTAIRFGRMALRAGPPLATTLSNLGVAYAINGDLRRAVSSTRQAASLVSDPCRIELNLAAYLVRAGQSERSLAVLSNLRTRYPHDVDVAFASADTLLGLSQSSEALRVLQHVRTHSWHRLDPTSQAELSVNLEYLRWRNSALSRDRVARELERQMRQIGFASARTAGMLPALFTTKSGVDKLKELVDGFEHAHQGLRCWSARMRVAELESDYELAAEAGRHWAASDPLDPVAATNLSAVLMDGLGAYDEAASITGTFLRRMPAATVLANNHAYALARLGQLADAERVLRALGGTSAFSSATHGLIRMLRGELRGLDDYQQAQDAATQSGNSDLAALVALARVRALGITRLSAKIDESVGKRARDEARRLLPADWADRREFEIAKRGFLLDGVAWPRA